MKRTIISSIFILLYGTVSHSMAQVILNDTVTVDVMLITLFDKKNYKSSNHMLDGNIYFDYHIVNTNDWDSHKKLNLTELLNLVHKKHDIYYLRDDIYRGVHYYILKSVYKNLKMSFDVNVISYDNYWYRQLDYTMYKKNKDIIECVPITVKCVRSFIPKDNPYYRMLERDGYKFVMDKVAIYSIFQVQQGDLVFTNDMRDD